MRTTLGRMAIIAFLAPACTGCIEAARQQAAINHYVRGQVLADKGQYDAALEELALAVKSDPKLSTAHAATGDIYRRRGSHELAKRSYERACDANPYAFRPHYNLGVTYQLLAEAATAVSQVHGLLQKAVFLYLRAAELEPGDFETHLNLSACYYQLGKYELAEQCCNAATKANPKSAEAWCNLGTIYDSQNRPYDAIRAYRISLELNSHQPQLLLNIGAAYVRQGRFDAAIWAYQTAAKEDPKSSIPWQQMGTCYYHLKEYLKALEAYEKAVKVDPGNADAHRGIGVIYMTQYVIDRSKTALRDKALAAWHGSLELNPNQDDLRRLVEKYTPKVALPQL